MMYNLVKIGATEQVKQLARYSIDNVIDPSRNAQYCEKTEKVLDYKEYGEDA